MIPIFRAKKINSNEYIEGCLNIWEQNGKIYHSIKEIGKYPSPFNNIHIIDESTLSIHFPDMLDSQGNKIFASLQEDGKGGDILKHINHIHQDDMPTYNPYYKKGDIKIEDIPLNSYNNIPNLNYYKIVGIQK